MKLRAIVSIAALTAVAGISAVTAHAATPGASAAPAAAVAPAPAVAPAAVPAPAAAPAAASAHAAKGVQVVRPGQLVPAGHGMVMKLTRTERCVGTPPDDWFTCKSVVDGNQPAGTVGLQSSGDTTGTLYSPLYIGDGKAVRMTVKAGGATYNVHVVTLAGHPGYATGYVWGAPATGAPGGPLPEVTVYDAAGKILAQL